MRNVFAAMLRILARDRRYTMLNILGLAAGFAAAIFIFLFVRNDLGYDRFLPDYRRTYLVTELDQVPGHAAISTPMVYFRLAGPMKLHFPEIEAIARLCPEQLTIRHDGVAADEKIYWADPDVFKVLRLPVVAGDLHQALGEPDGIVITRSLARKYFGRDAPIGYVVYAGSFDTLTVKLDGRHIPETLAEITQSWHDSGQIKPLAAFFLDTHMLIAWPVAGQVMSRWLAGFAYHVPLPLRLFPAVTSVALVIALITVSAHSILVARARPIAALRYE